MNYRYVYVYLQNCRHNFFYQHIKIKNIMMYSAHTGDQGNDLTGPRWLQSFSDAEEERKKATEDRERSVGSRTILECQP